MVAAARLGGGRNGRLRITPPIAATVAGETSPVQAGEALPNGKAKPKAKDATNAERKRCYRERKRRAASGAPVIPIAAEPATRNAA